MPVACRVLQLAAQQARWQLCSCSWVLWVYRRGMYLDVDKPIIKLHSTSVHPPPSRWDSAECYVQRSLPNREGHISQAATFPRSFAAPISAYRATAAGSGR